MLLLRRVEIFYFSICFGFIYGVPIKKCCPPKTILDPVTLTCKTLASFRASSFNYSVFPTKMLDAQTDFQSISLSSIIPTNFSSADLSVEFTNCGKSPLKILPLGNETAYLITSSGQLRSLYGEFQPSFDIGKFCIDLIANGTNQELSRVALVCDPCRQTGRTCIRTCCPHGQILDANFSCIQPPDSSDELLVYPDWNDDENSASVKREFILAHPDSIFLCPKNRNDPYGEPFDYAPDYYTLHSDGSIDITAYNKTDTFRSGLYCIGFLNVSSSGKKYHEASFKLCTPTEDESCYKCYSYPICCTISNIFLLITFVVYAILPDLHGPLFGKITMAFIVSLFVAYLTLTISYVGSFDLIKYQGCKPLGYLIQFSFLHAFLWMNVMAYDIYQKFRQTVMIPTKPSRQGNQFKRFSAYFAYAFIIPLVVFVITVNLNNMKDRMGNPLRISPEIGTRNCFFDKEQKFSMFYLFFLPLLLVQLSNIAFFSMTVSKLIKTWKLTKSVNMRSTGEQNTNQSHNLVVVKLFVVMGINWFFEFLSFIAHWQWDPETAQNISYFNDTVNLLQGVLMFGLLVFKKSIYKKLRDKFWKSDDSRTNSTRLTSD